MANSTQMSTPTPYVLTNVRIAPMVANGEHYGGIIENGAIAIDGEKIAWVGPAQNMPANFHAWHNKDVGGSLATPALIDAHTHIVFGGDRANEFEMRLEGASYEEVARAGGGIISTVTATRAASCDQLVASALPRLDALIAEGVTTIEVKSGYGLNLDSERNMLMAARQLGAMRNITVRTSFLGAHATPPDYKDRPDDYIRLVAENMLPQLHAEGLVDAVDGFCENIAFSPAQMKVVFDAAQRLGLPIKLHAEQLSNLGGAALAASYGALSADHLEYLDEAGVTAMAKAGSVAVLLPGAFYTLRETQMPPIELLRNHQVPIGLATDCNPGSSPLTSLLLTMNMGATLFRLTPDECLAATTRHAAKALGLVDRGTLAAGQRADIALWNIQHPAELSYRIGFNPLKARIFGGK